MMRKGGVDLRILVLLALVMVSLCVVPLLTSDRYQLKVLTLVGINVITVTGMALLFGFAGQVSLGHAAFVGIGAYTSAYVVSTLGWPWLIGPVAAVVVAALGGFLLALPSLRLRGHYLAMATLGFGEIMRVVFVEASAVTGGPDGFSGIPYPSLAGLEIDSPAGNYWLVWGVAVVSMVLSANLVRSRSGRAMRALHGSESGAMACGIDVTAVKVRVFVLSAALAGLAGALHAHVIGFISPASFSLHVSVLIVAMAVAGGTRSLVGPALAATLLTLIPYADAVIPGLSRPLLDAIQAYQEDAYGLAISAVMLFAPAGLAGLLRRAVAVRGWRLA
ncbi:MAG: branched-chain amino acid ABC transporter permease [Coriobacteriia bacterium]|jgi:branched-chain amino acid transport system permease protein|nr:branched-chain amino acid ABC transporter permease [Coriobacteriia bacterium]